MRLLSTNEVKKASQKQTDRGREIDKHITKKTRELNEFRDRYEKEKKKILDDFVAFAEDITGRKTQLEGRFASLEAKKGQAFKSLSDLSARAEKRFGEAQAIEATFDVREHNLEAREAKLNEDRKKTDERESNLNTLAEDLSAERKRLDKYDDDLQSRANKIAANLQERENVVGKKEEQVEKRLEELNLSIEANNSTAKLLELREKEFEKYKEEQEKLLQDKRETLDRAWNELSTKQHGNG